MSLSKENYSRLNENFLYQKEPTVTTATWSASHPYHCKNWTFKVYKLQDGRAFMLDTYFDSWDSHKIQVTDENIDDFKIVFDFRDVKRIRDSEYDEYNDEDLYRVATNSGGWTCGNLYWVHKETQKSKQLLIDKKKNEIQYLKHKLERTKNDLERLLEI